MADNLTAAQRSYCMSRVKSKDTALERIVGAELKKHGLRFRKNDINLPGKPDITFPQCRVAIFVDGDFWHGFRFPQWKHSLSPFWRSKIEKNRERDRRNFSRLRRQGWRVVRVWKHSIEKDLGKAVARIYRSLDRAL